MRYRKLPAAIDWLCAAFGFEKHHVGIGDDGEIFYAHLTLGDDIVMVRSVLDSHLDKLMKQPDEIGGVQTQSCYFVVDDADAHYHKAVRLHMLCDSPEAFVKEGSGSVAV